VAARLCLNGSFAELLRRIRAEYLEMPGLRLTAPQAQCLFGLDSETWDAVSAALWTRSSFPTPTTACSRWQPYRRSDGPDVRNRRSGKISPPSTQPFRSWRSLPVGLTRRVVLFTSVIRKRSTCYAKTENRA
jgi:hypothetical protein